MKILVCEDSLMTQKTIEYTLVRNGHEVVNASDGEQGIRILNEEQIDLVITDINMPHNKGLEIVQYIKQKFGGRIPVIVISSINLQETIVHAKELGAMVYLTKPFNPDDLIKNIQLLTSN